MIATLILELREVIPPNLPAEPADMDRAKWAPWEDAAIAAMETQAKHAAGKLGCTLAGRRSVKVEVRQDWPIGRWLFAEFILEWAE